MTRNLRLAHSHRCKPPTRLLPVRAERRDDAKGRRPGTAAALEGMKVDWTDASPIAHLAPSPERRLMAAVLNDATEAYLDPPGPRRRSLRRELDEWFASDATDWPFSFVNVCHSLALDPDAVRADVARATLPCAA
jgi:hypothetical protein